MKNFTDTYIRNLKAKDKRYEEFEGAGFGIRVTPNGVKSWIYRYKINGTTTKFTMGHYPAMSLSNAKRRFLELSQMRREGIDPKSVIQAQAEQDNNTVDKLALNWYSHYVEKHVKRPFVIKRQIDNDIIPLLGKKKLDEVQTRDISDALDTIVKRGARILANRTLSSIKQMFNYAVSRGYMPFNPANNIRSRDIGGIEKPKERVLSLEEIKALWLFLDGDGSQMSTQTRIAIKIMLLTGVRTAELRLASWHEIDLDASLWTIPAMHSKASIIHKVHLSPLTKSLFLQLKPLSHSDYVLTGADGFHPMTENAIPRAIKRIQERLGIPDWTAHDLRRTFATQLGETLQVDPVVIEKCLGHKMPRIMATYNRNEMLPPRQDALESWSNCIHNLLQDKVVYMHLKP
ncbi:tyrosine-type recombinase/integrase [Legionella spiritensis]|uniref:tyrosine-type recombinase/integrase n=1 Tax=Legionella spiritensis TaxID=452 RepID=UPI000F70D3D2|nr:site-specific integrase [Legionella spiritensis]VEG91670.1 integrase [Legionella spiritensis]